MRFSDCRKPCVPIGQRYAFIVARCHKPEFCIQNLSLSNSEIRDRWHLIVKQYGLSSWCYEDDLDCACIPDAEEIDVKPNTRGNPDKCLAKMNKGFMTFFKMIYGKG